MKRAHCQECGTVFYREDDADWKVRCIPCYRKSKRAEPVAKTVVVDNYWAERAAVAESKAAVLQLKVLHLESQVNNLIGQSLRQPPPSRIDRELAEHWRSLVQLVHPDRHGGSQGATKMTQWLNDVKRRLPCD